MYILFVNDWRAQPKKSIIGHQQHAKEKKKKEENKVLFGQQNNEWWFAYFQSSIWSAHAAM